jgi:hypothetical protein
VLNSSIEGTESSGNGGGLYAHSSSVGSEITLSGVHIKNTKSTGSSSYGGGACLISSRVRVINSEIEGTESGAHGGGLYVYANSGEIIISGGYIKNSKITGDGWGAGGGAYLYAAGDIQVSNIIIDNTEAQGVGGGMVLYSNGSATTISGVDIKNTKSSNIAGTGGGGAIYAGSYGSITISDSQFKNTSAGIIGGAICLTSSGSFNLSGLTIEDSQSRANGGGIYISSDVTGSKSISNSSFTNCKTSSSTWGGGGIICPTGTTISGCTYSGCSPDNVRFY